MVLLCSWDYIDQVQGLTCWIPSLECKEQTPQSTMPLSLLLHLIAPPWKTPFINIALPHPYKASATIGHYQSSSGEVMNLHHLDVS